MTVLSSVVCFSLLGIGMLAGLQGIIGLIWKPQAVGLGSGGGAFFQLVFGFFGMPFLALVAATVLAPAPSANHPAPKSWAISSSDGWGCRSLDTMDRFGRLRRDGDRDAFGHLLIDMHRSGECRSFDGGQKVVIGETKLLSGMTKVRVAGEASEYWVPTGYVSEVRP